MPSLYSLPDTPEIAQLRRNDTRYRLRRWNAYVAAKNDGEFDGDFEDFAKRYDAVSDMMTLDDPPISVATDRNATKGKT